MSIDYYNLASGLIGAVVGSVISCAIAYFIMRKQITLAYIAERLKEKNILLSKYDVHIGSEHNVDRWNFDANYFADNIREYGMRCIKTVFNAPFTHV